MHPCLIVPTSDLTIGPTKSSVSQPIAIPIVATPNIIISPVQRTLDEKTGLAILTYVYDNKSLFYDEDDEDDRPAIPESSFFGLPSKKKSANERSLIEKGKTLMNLYPRKDNIRFIDKWFLMKHKLTVEILISECKVEITNLKRAGILSTFEDLCEVGFRLKDLVLDRELFNVGHIVQLYGMDANSLDLTLEDLLECHFIPAELLTLQFSLPDMIENTGICGRHVQRLGYDLQSLIQLGLTKKHLKKLGITYPIAVNVMKWDPKEVSQMS